MNEWWSGLSLKNKLQLPIQFLLLAVMVIAQRSALDKFEEYVLEGAKQKALVSADGVLNGLNMLMINGIISNAEQRALYVKKMGSSEHIDELRVIRNKPVQDQFGPGLPAEQAADEMDRAALNSAQVQTKLLKQGDDRRSLRVVIPFIAKKEFRGTNCLMCHTVPEGTVNGATSITLDLSGEFALMRKANYVLWGAQLAIQLILYFVIGWVIGLVTGSTRELQKTMQGMQADGDLSKRAVVRSQDEIGKTAQAFNDLASGFQVIVSHVEGHASQVASAAHHLSEDAALMSQSSQQQSDAANATAAAVEQVSSSIAQVADATSRVAKLSHESMERADRGQQSLQEMMQELENVEGAVNEIATSVGEFVSNTQNITNMTQQVRDIAEQTN
ncbi:MAG TPA: methyl-accepting chemotaxis protein, partial [Gallionella sp.]|nr:methyl-accepting chemotaxis protein [Gallionella sp.]